MLYAHAFHCAFHGCQRPLHRVIEQSGAKILNSRVCHINARREGGPRWDPGQSPKDNRSEDNLILMCIEHASTIDNPVTLSAYTAERLREWKAKQLQEYERLKKGWPIDSEMAREAIRASFSSVGVAVTNSTVNLIAEGGKAPGAGGAGGPAIGPGAHGGSGGDQVSTLIDLAVPETAGLDRIQVVVGQGGSGSRVPGQHGDNGGDTLEEFPAKEGTLLKSLRASGGSGGRSGTSYLPNGAAEVSPEEIKGGFRITTLMAVNAAELREGLVFVLGGGWHRYYVPHIPFEAVWNVVCTARWRSLEGARGLFLSLIHPAGREASCKTLTIPAEAAQHRAHHWIGTIGTSFDAEGAWTLRVHSGGSWLAETDIHVLIAS
jgi:hypothetical protein